MSPSLEARVAALEAITFRPDGSPKDVAIVERIVAGLDADYEKRYAATCNERTLKQHRGMARGWLRRVREAEAAEALGQAVPTKEEERG